MNDSEEGRVGDMEGGAIPDLEGFYSDREPPPELEERVVEDYRSAVGGERRAPPGNARRRSRSDAGARTTWARVAAAVVVFAAGWGVGVYMSPGVEPGPDASPFEMPSYMMLLREGEGFAPEDDPTAVADAYAAWARSVARTGIDVSGEELGSDRAIVGDEPGQMTGSDRIGGFFLLGVATLDEAQTLAESHPHVAAGGVIEIAPVVRR